jgi:hypothetical protein
MILTKDGDLSVTGNVRGKYLQVNGIVTPNEQGGFIYFNSTTGYNDMIFGLHRGSKNAGSWWWKDFTNSGTRDILKLDAGIKHMRMHGTIQVMEGLTVDAGTTSLQATSVNGSLSVTVDAGVNGTVTAGKVTTNRLQVIRWVDPSSQGAHIGWNRENGLGRTSFANQRGGGWGGWEWISYSNSNVFERRAMYLGSDGNLLVEGNITVNGTINNSGMPTSQNASLVGLWQGAFNGYAGGVSVQRLGSMVSIRIGYFEVTPTKQTVGGDYSEMLPTWARPTGLGTRRLSYIVPFNNNSSGIARLYINGSGLITFAPIGTWSLVKSSPDGEINVSYHID